MLTRNFMQWIGWAGMGLENSTNDIILKDGNHHNYLGIGSDQYSPMSASSWGNSAFLIGNGTTKPKVNDYWLENEITEGYTCSSLRKIHTMGGEKDQWNVNGILTNTNVDTSITFTEIVLKVQTPNLGPWILAREVYDTPITIAPGESIAVNVNIL